MNHCAVFLCDPKVMRYLEPPYSKEQTGLFLQAALQEEVDLSVVAQSVCLPFEGAAFEKGHVAMY